MGNLTADCIVTEAMTGTLNASWYWLRVRGVRNQRKSQVIRTQQTPLIISPVVRLVYDVQVIILYRVIMVIT